MAITALFQPLAKGKSHNHGNIDKLYSGRVSIWRQQRLNASNQGVPTTSSKCDLNYSLKYHSGSFSGQCGKAVSPEPLENNRCGSHYLMHFEYLQHVQNRTIDLSDVAPNRTNARLTNFLAA